MKPRSATCVAILLVLLVVQAALASETGTVVEVVDGDTLKVELGGALEKIRLIGVDTPETVHPQKPVEFFGKEAAAFTRRMALNRVVRLEEDPEGDTRDKYGRLLRYVFLPDGKLLNAEIIAQGYGHAYTRFPFSRMEEFRALEREAREATRGLWGAEGASQPTPEHDEAHPQERTAPSADGEQTVYVTHTGTKYHRGGCKYLAHSSIPISLKDVTRRYRPCLVCNPPAFESGGEERPGPAPEGSVGAAPSTAAPPETDGSADPVVYVTRTGTKYHRAGCRYLARSSIPMKLSTASKSYGPCSACTPPVPKEASRIRSRGMPAPEDAASSTNHERGPTIEGVGPVAQLGCAIRVVGRANHARHLHLQRKAAGKEPSCSGAVDFGALPGAAYHTRHATMTVSRAVVLGSHRALVALTLGTPVVVA